MKRRSFIKKSSILSASGLLAPFVSRSSPLVNNTLSGGQIRPDIEKIEILYNGIRLPKVWPPQNMSPDSYEPMPVPYLHNPPDVIPINVGRQLLVDDFLIENTTLKRAYHKALKYDNNPVLKPETALEKGDEGLPVACPKDGGVWWDPADRVFKMWYEAAWIGSMAYATSVDGIHWERPNIRPGSNQLFPKPRPDSTTVFLDHDSRDPGERFKMFLRGPNWARDSHGFSFVSPDGIHWGEPFRTGHCGDRSTMFYNPFRRKWIYSIRSGGPLRTGVGRARYYREHSDFIRGAGWRNDNIVFWTGADRLDPPDPVIGEKAQLYNLSAVGYESIMLGLHQIHLGPPNNECQKVGMPKITELMLSYSRDGFHWHRPDREAFIPATRRVGDWERGYVQSVGGICHIVGDQLWFYYTGFKGDPTNLHSDQMKSGMYANGSTGLAVLRRDGFISLSATGNGGTLLTRLVSFNGKYLFVNIDCPQGELRAEVLNENNSVIAPFSAENCIPISSDSTLKQVSWKGSGDLSALAGTRVRFRFYLKNGDLYSFWVSPDDSGASYGYVGAGGPGYTGWVDNVGNKAYDKASEYRIP